MRRKKERKYIANPNLWYGLTPVELDNAISEAQQLLVQIARQQEDPITYGELYRRLSKPPEHDQPNVPIRSASRFCGKILDKELDAGRPPLTALVVNANTRQPGQGFANLLRHRGQDVKTERQAWHLALAEVYGYYGENEEDS